MTVRSAVIGAGTVSDNHLSGVQENPQTELVGVCDIDYNAAKEKGKQYNTAPFSEVESLLNEDIDCLHICTPVQTHHEIAQKALKEEVAVIIEKPVTTTVEEVEDLIKISESKGVPATIIHSHLFDPQIRKVRRLISKGKIGRVKGVDIIYSGLSLPDDVNRGSWVFDLPGGEFEEGLPHPIYTGLGFSGFPASQEKISVQTALSREYEGGFSYDSAQAQFTTRSGVLCNIKMLSEPPVQRLIIVHGSDQSVLIDRINLSVQFIDEDYSTSALKRAKKSADTSLSQINGLIDAVRYMAKLQMNDDWQTQADIRAHYGIFDQFVNVLNGGGQPPVSLEQGKWTIQIIENIREEAKNK